MAMTEEIRLLRLPSIGRRTFLWASATGVMAFGLGSLSSRRATAAGASIRWVSPRGTLEVLDDYPYWIAKKMGYFGDLETTLEPGPLEASACVKLVDQNQSDMGFPSPGVFSLGLEQGMKLVSAWEMGAFDVFDYAFRKGEAPKDLAGLKGKTIVLGSAGWQAICDPMFASNGIDPASIKYVEAGNSWGQVLAQGKADAALSWEGLRAQWKGQGLDFDYLIGRNFSKLPANTFVMRRADFEDASKKETYTKYLRGWAMGLEFGYLNPRAATHITMQQFPGLASQMKPPVAVESMMQLANVFRGNFEKRKGWGWHDEEAWALFFKTIKDIGQIHGDIKVADVIKNNFVAGANEFDKAKVKADADGYKLPDDYVSIDAEAIRKGI
jgi:NitT/TauT family transport system substrate-binding protein